MAACGRVRRMFRLSVALLLLLLLAVAAAERVLSPGSHSQGPGQGSKLLSLVGQGGGGSPAEQPPPPQLLQQQQQQSQQQQQQPQPPQPPFPAGGPPARRGGAGPGGTGGGWKLAEEESCREDVTRVCPKHTWSNNLAVLECLQDVREFESDLIIIIFLLFLWRGRQESLSYQNLAAPIRIERLFLDKLSAHERKQPELTRVQDNSSRESGLLCFSSTYAPFLSLGNNLWKRGHGRM